MGGILQNLKDIFGFDIKFSLVNVTNIKIVKGPDEGDKFCLSQDEKELLINLPALNAEDFEKIKKATNEAFKEEEFDVIGEKQYERIKDIGTKLKNEKEVLDFYEGKISKKHLRALEASLYVKQVFDRGGSVSSLKKDIISKYGDDGRNICNLCSTGYFHGYIKDVYNELLQQPDFHPDIFRSHFETIIWINPFAIFVSREMPEEELSGMIAHRLSQHRKYGIKFLNIHGISRDNIKKIREVISEYEGRDDIEITINQEKNIILVTINFKNQK